MDLEETLASVRSRSDLARFVEQLADDLEHNPDGWENGSLPRYLEALAAWLHDMEGTYRNRGEALPEQPSWQTLGEILLAASIYE
jgi:hypothetical protein